MLDVPENQFVKAFLDQAELTIERVRDHANRMKPGHFSERLLGDCDRMTRALAPARQHPLWRGVSELRRLPAESPVLQRGRGYREVFRAFTRLRQSARLVPWSDASIQQLLEIKDIAELYEMWCFFEVQRQITLALGRAPTRAGEARVSELEAHLGWGLRIVWAGGIELFYNLSYSRKGADRSYSVLLRPDVVLRVHRGPDHEDHLFDAKFKVRHLADTLASEEDEPSSTERQGVFKRADLYKMHAYRDAIPAARSAWILYPGSQLRFFSKDGKLAESVEEVQPTPTGVGAIPLSPGLEDDNVARLVQRLICSARPGLRGGSSSR